jgi:hypothetical protein
MNTVHRPTSPWLEARNSVCSMSRLKLVCPDRNLSSSASIVDTNEGSPPCSEVDHVASRTRSTCSLPANAGVSLVEPGVPALDEQEHGRSWARDCRNAPSKQPSAWSRPTRMSLVQTSSETAGSGGCRLAPRGGASLGGLCRTRHGLSTVAHTFCSGTFRVGRDGRIPQLTPVP